MDVKKFEKVPLLACQRPTSGPRRANLAQLLGFLGTVKEYFDTLKSFCYFWALDMAPTWAGPGLLNLVLASWMNGEFRNFVKRCCLDLAIQSWHVKIRTSSLCETYSTFKHQLKLESYLHCLKPRERTQLSTFRCAPSFLPNVRNKIATCCC